MSSSIVSLTALGSGSRGNAFVLTCGANALLVDAGFSRRELCCRMSAVGLDPARVRAVLITHEHDDHVKGCRVFCDRLDIPMYATSRTADRLRRGDRAPARVREFEPGSCFDVAGFEISPFAVPHDAVDPVGFLIRCGDCRIGMATDLGRVNPLIKLRLAGSDALVLESNYDLRMLLDSDRDLRLKRRIRGQFGHLDNLDAAAALPELVGERTRLVLYAHVSCECNTYECAAEAGRRALALAGRGDIRFDVVRQDSPLAPFPLTGGAEG